MKYAVGIDVGGTNTRVALINEEYKILERIKFSTDSKDPEVTLQKIGEIIKGFAKEIEGIGISCPGPLDLIGGVVLTPPNLPGWHYLPLSKRLEEITGVKVALENDANLAALAEALVGAGAGKHFVQFLTISTGVGAGLCVNGKIYHGAKGFGQEVANSIVWRDGPSQGDLKKGSIESIASGTAITKRANDAGISAAHAGEVYEAAKAGNETAKEIMEDTYEYLSNFLGTLYGVLDPEIFILSGSVALKIPGFIKEVEKRTKEKVYDALKEKLMKKGIPEEEIAFIHDANTDVQKARLFSKVRSGQVRFLLGSTSKMGAGTNVQDRLIALHHLDVPWRPADIEQQEGRILRQGNKNKKVKIFRYITENTFDAYSWQLIENKQKFIGQIMTSKSPVRSCQDVDEAALSYAEVKALATGNPKIKEKMDLDVQVTKLKMLKANYESNLFRLQDAIAVEYPEKIAKYEELTTAYDSDIKHIDTVLNTPFLMEIHGVTYNDEKAAGEMLVQACTQMKKAHADAENIGSFLGFQMKISYSLFDNSFYVRLTREASFIVEVKKDPVRNIERILTAMRNLPGQKKTAEERLEDARQQLVQAKEEVQKPFEKEEELKFIQARLVKVNAELDVGSDEEKIQKDGKNRQEEQRICL